MRGIDHHNMTPFKLTHALLVFIISGLLPLKAIATAKAPKSTPKKYLMATLGDSITAGVLASTQLNWFNTGKVPTTEAVAYENYIGKLVGYNETQSDQEKQSRLRVSFDMKQSLFHLLETRNTDSWATGRDVPSQFILLKDYLNRKEPGVVLEAVNPAITGGITSDLIPQADIVINEIKSGKYALLKYVTLLIGNNDACTNRPFDEMKSDLHIVFSKLASIKQKEPIRILMSGIPRIPDLGEDGISESKTLFKFTCSTFRTSITKVCLPLTEWNGQGQYQDRIQYTQSVNELLMSAAADANATFPNLEVRFTNRLFDQGLIRTELAIDCFHPTAASQSRMSQELWLEQPWFK
jgi:lysophospholipase L1-like esterase